jgi:ABC-type nitrate/sulfonate/bicarbonate transport system permease component
MARVSEASPFTRTLRRNALMVGLVVLWEVAARLHLTTDFLLP